MRLVIVESPFKPSADATTESQKRYEILRNTYYARACMHDCLLRGEAPFASHALYTLKRVLRDDVPEERKLGIEAGFAWKKVAHATVVYDDFGISEGMQLGIDAAREMGHVVVMRSLNRKIIVELEQAARETLTARTFLQDVIDLL